MQGDTQNPIELNIKGYFPVSKNHVSFLFRSKDPYLERFPTEIMVLWNHNHTIGTASALKHRPPTKELENTFTELFSSGHSPSSALDLFNEHGDDYYKVVADGSKCPTRHWCYDLYYKIFQ
jgi:hypothetical protein